MIITSLLINKLVATCTMQYLYMYMCLPSRIRYKGNSDSQGDTSGQGTWRYGASAYSWCSLYSQVHSTVSVMVTGLRAKYNGSGSDCLQVVRRCSLTGTGISVDTKQS